MWQDFVFVSSCPCSFSVLTFEVGQMEQTCLAIANEILISMFARRSVFSHLSALRESMT